MTDAAVTVFQTDPVETEKTDETEFVGNQDFLRAVFHGDLGSARPVVVSFKGDPRTVPKKSWSGEPWQSNSGQAAAKNHGVRESSGSYIAFLDADDMWVPDKLELQMPMFLRSENVGVVYSRLSYIDESGRDLRIADNELFRGRVTGPLLIRNFIGFGSTIVRKACFDRLGGFRDDLRMGIDYDLWLRFSTQYEFDYVDRPLLRYRVWSGQMSNNCRGRYLNGIEIMNRFLREFPGIVDKATEDHAWAHTYVGFGQCLQSLDAHVGPALKLYARALRHRPSYLPAWRAIVTSILRLQ